MIFCVVGGTLTGPDLFHQRLCDYIIYAELVATATSNVNGFFPLHSATSWEAFSEGAIANAGPAAGVSFSAAGVGQPESTLSLVPDNSVHLAQLVRRLYLTTMGVLDFPRFSGISANSLTPAYKAMADALRLQNPVEPSLFMGAWLYEPLTTQDFAAEVATIPNMKLIILQTHISKMYYAGGPLLNSTDIQEEFHLHTSKLRGRPESLVIPAVARRQHYRFAVLHSWHHGIRRKAGIG
ncbi:hypothetical protein MTO96_007334 [Rhipicephalus appendiculatus]